MIEVAIDEEPGPVPITKLRASRLVCEEVHEGGMDRSNLLCVVFRTRNHLTQSEEGLTEFRWFADVGLSEPFGGNSADNYVTAHTSRPKVRPTRNLSLDRTSNEPFRGP